MDTPPFETATAASWAQQEFGDADFGDTRRTARLCAMAAAAATHPAGRITQVFGDDAAGRQGAYDWVENPATSYRALVRPQRRAAARRCRDAPVAIVAVDGTDLTVTDRAQVKDTGRTSDRVHTTRGFNVVSALAVRPDGVTAGLVGQVFWARSDARITGDRHQRPLEAKESWHVHVAIAQSDRSFAAAAPGTRPWYQVDRLGDDAQLLLAALECGRLLTVRAYHDRRVIDLEASRLMPLATTRAVLGAYDVALAARAGVAARVAHVEVRAGAVTLLLRDRRSPRLVAATVHTVWVREVAPPAGVTPLDWTLHTTYPVDDFGDACVVIEAYALRWRVEEFHRTWKSGGCHVEDAQLRSVAAVQKWSGLLASVATRLMYLRDLARTEPARPASDVFSAEELEAVVTLRQPRDHVPGQMPTVVRVVRWVAELGGYTGKSSGGPPGVTVLARGMESVRIAMITLANLKKPRWDQ